MILLISHLKAKTPKHFQKKKHLSKLLCQNFSLHFLQEPQKFWRVIHTDLRWPPSLAPRPGTRSKDNIMLTQGRINPCKAASKTTDIKLRICRSSAEVKVTDTHIKVFRISALPYKARIWREQKSLKELASCFGKAHLQHNMHTHTQIQKKKHTQQPAEQITLLGYFMCLKKSYSHSPLILKCRMANSCVLHMRMDLPEQIR